MSDTLDEDEIRLRRERMENLLESVKSEEKTIQNVIEEEPDIMPWAFVLNNQTEMIEIIQTTNGGVVAITQDPQWADMVVGMLNRAHIFAGVMEIDEEGEK
jgi:hypothetical protein